MSSLAALSSPQPFPLSIASRKEEPSEKNSVISTTQKQSALIRADVAAQKSSKIVSGLKGTIKSVSNLPWRKIVVVASGVLLGLKIVHSAHARAQFVAASYSRSREANFSGCRPFYVEDSPNFFPYHALDRSLCYNKEAGLALESDVIANARKYEGSDLFQDRLCLDLTNDKDFMSRLVSAEIGTLKLLGPNLKNNFSGLLQVLKAAQNYRSYPDYQNTLKLMQSLAVKDKGLSLQALSLCPVEETELVAFYEALDPNLQYDVEILLAFVQHVGEDYFARQAVRTIINRYGDNEALASALLSRNPREFMKIHYHDFSKQVTESVSLQKAISSHFELIWNEAVQKTQSQEWKEWSEVEYGFHIREHYLPLLNLNVVVKFPLSNEAILHIIKTFPGNLGDLIEIFGKKLGERIIDLALIDAFEASPFHQKFNQDKEILFDIASDCKDEEIAEKLYKLDRECFDSFSRLLKNNDEFLKRIGREKRSQQPHSSRESLGNDFWKFFSQYSWERFFGSPPHRGNSFQAGKSDRRTEIKKYLQMDSWSRALSAELSADNKKHARLILFNDMVNNEEEAQSILKEFETFEKAECKIIKRHWRALSLKGHPDKLGKGNTANERIAKAVTTMNAALHTCCATAQTWKAKSD